LKTTQFALSIASETQFIGDFPVEIDEEQIMRRR
jgi:hypothetical protein